MIDLILEKSLNLEFQLDIDNNEKLPEVRLNIKIDENIDFHLKGNVVNNIATITIPNLEKYSDLIEAKVLEGRLEVFADGRVFYPWEDTFSVIKEVKVSAAVKVEKSIKAKPMKVNLKKVEELKEPTIIELEKSIIIEGLELSKGDKLAILSEKRDGYKAIKKTIDIDDIRLEKGDYVKVIK